MTNEEKDKKEYELALLVKNESDVAGVVALVGQHNAENISEPRAKRLGLAYEIKKQTEAVFASFTFHAFGDDAKALENDLNNRHEVIRFMVIASPVASEQSASPILPPDRRPMRPSRPMTSSSDARDSRDMRPAPSRPLSNEALEKKIEEILQ
jgi:ribosomal protein S6